MQKIKLKTSPIVIPVAQMGREIPSHRGQSQLGTSCNYRHFMQLPALHATTGISCNYWPFNCNSKW